MKLNIYNWPYIDKDFPTGRLPENAQELTSTMRDLRDVLLKECDWVVVPDSPISGELKQEWLAWRQWMRDITSHIQVNDGDKWVEIPEPPAGYPKSWVNVVYAESDETGI